MVYISQLHLTTVMLLTGKIKLVEKEGDKEVVVDEGKAPPVQTCTDEQKKKVKEMITAYVDASPKPPAPPAADGGGTRRGSGSAWRRPAQRPRQGSARSAAAPAAAHAPAATPAPAAPKP